MALPYNLVADEEPHHSDYMGGIKWITISQSVSPCHIFQKAGELQPVRLRF
jgi:hypothetical protein